MFLPSQVIPAGLASQIRPPASGRAVAACPRIWLIIGTYLPETFWNDVTLADFTVNELAKAHRDLTVLRAATEADPGGLGVRVRHVVVKAHPRRRALADPALRRRHLLLFLIWMGGSGRGDQGG